MKLVHFNDLTNPSFKEAFVEYFREFGFKISVDSDIFEDMKSEDGNCIISYQENDTMIAFIMYRKDALSNWFFNMNFVFIREFWVKPKYRNLGLGKSLLIELETIAKENSIHKLVLTTDCADEFYLNFGYISDISFSANNHDRVYTKLI